MSERKVDPDMAIWMRRAGITVDVVAHYFGSSAMAVKRATKGHQPKYSEDAWNNIEMTILRPPQAKIPAHLRREYRQVRGVLGAERAREAFPELVEAFRERRERL